MNRRSFEPALRQKFFPRLPGPGRLQIFLGSLRNRLRLVKEIPTFGALRRSGRYRVALRHARADR